MFSSFICTKKSLAAALSLTGALCLTACSSVPAAQHSGDSGWQSLLDDDLSQWEVWMGVPHSSVQGLPEGTHTQNSLTVNGNPNDAMGLNSDVKGVFSVIEQDGEQLLYITGEIYGGLTTKASFENYHLQMKAKWGEKKWAPRLDKKRDSGVLFHCNGPHGAFWKVWKACQELQVQEKDFGDYIPLAGPKGTIRMNKEALAKNTEQYDPASDLRQTVKGYASASHEPDKPNGEWNLIDLYAFGDVAVFAINNEVVMVVTDSRDAKGNALTSGQLQIQSEGAELYYKDIQIRSITSLPSAFNAMVKP